MRDLLEAQAAAHPSRLGLAEGERRSTYADLDRDASRLAAALAAHGVRPGARVATLLPATAEHIVALHAVWRLAACPMPLSPTLPAAEVRAAARHAKADLCLVDARTEPLARTVGLAPLAADARVDPPAPAAERSADDLAALVPTSGTGGSPRVVRLLWRNLVASAEASADRLGTGPDDRWLLALPLDHVGGLSIPVRAAVQGAAVIVATRDLGSHLDAQDANVVSLVPTQLRRLVDARSGRAFPSGARVLLGGAPASDDLVAEARALGLDVRRTYGLTEAASQVATETLDGRVLPLHGTAVRVAADGTLEVRGPTIADGYEGDEGASRATFVDGWLRTGDLGEVLADGSVRVSGRADAVIVTGGEKVSPEAVEAVLRAHPAVAEVSVVGVPDREWGERVVAAVVVRSAASPEELRAFVRTRLAPHAVPKEIRVVEALPRTPSGKVLRRDVARAFRKP